jgi:hypothetical protein
MSRRLAIRGVVSDEVMDEEEGILWAALTTVVGLGVATAARKLTAKTWTKRRGFVPGRPGDGQTSWQEAAVFAVVSGATVGLSRLVADRVIAAAKQKASSRTA